MSNSELHTYEHFYAVVKTHFPTGKLRCSFCTYYDKRSNRCNLTQTLCFFPNEHMNDDCPLVPEEEEQT